MKLKTDYAHIFFDRYEVDKEKEARFIILKALSEMECDFSEKDMVFTIQNADFEKEMEIKKLCDILKREFFIILKEVKEEKAIDSKPCFSDIVIYIKKNYLYDTLTIGEICESVGISRKEADSLLKDECNMTVSEYLRNLRVEKAAQQLALGVSIEECAALCGLGSVKTMQRAFKSVLGKTPSEYRESYNLDSKSGE